MSVIVQLYERRIPLKCFSGESMENALRACCKGIKIGKILIHRDGDETQVLTFVSNSNMLDFCLR